MRSGDSEFCLATGCACEFVWACKFPKELGYTVAARLLVEASACIGFGVATRLQTGAIETR